MEEIKGKIRYKEREYPITIHKDKNGYFAKLDELDVTAEAPNLNQLTQEMFLSIKEYKEWVNYEEIE